MELYSSYLQGNFRQSDNIVQTETFTGDSSLSPAGFSPLPATILLLFPPFLFPPGTPSPSGVRPCQPIQIVLWARFQQHPWSCHLEHPPAYVHPRTYLCHWMSPGIQGHVVAHPPVIPSPTSTCLELASTLEQAWATREGKVSSGNFQEQGKEPGR